MTKIRQAPDPWQRTTTEHGFAADEVISALQKCLRRGAEIGRDYRYFMEEASVVVPEIANMDQKYRDWIMAALAAGKIS